MEPILTDGAIPFFAEYFHAISLDEEKNIFTTNAGSVIIEARGTKPAFDVTAKYITPLKEGNILRSEGENILIPLVGQFVMPETTGPEKFPLVLIGHGNHRVKNSQGWVHSYKGYLEFQQHLAENGIASYSIDLSIVNILTNNETVPFDSMGLDFNQRILHFFFFFFLLKIIVG